MTVTPPSSPAGAANGLAKAITGAILLLIPVVGIYLANPAPTGPVASPPAILATVGQPAEVLAADSQSWRPGAVPIALHAGDAVRSSQSISLTLVEGSIVQLQPGAQVLIGAYTEATRHLQIRQITGTIVVDTANPNLTIETAATVAALRPGSFRIVAQGDNATVTVFRGTVAGKAGDSEVPIGEGEEVRLTAGQSQAVRWERPAAPTPVPVATRAPTPTPMPTVGPAQRTHIVEQGDTLLYLAAKYRTTVEAIQRLNNITDPHSLSIGQKLLIPPAAPAQ